jgi:hypothetical protein
MDKRRLTIVGVMLMLSAVSYSRIKGSDEVRPVLFLSIFAMGILFGVLLIGIINKFRNKNE